MRGVAALRCFSQARRPIRAELGQIERYDCEIVAAATRSCSCSWRSVYPNSQNRWAEVRVISRRLQHDLVPVDRRQRLDRPLCARDRPELDAVRRATCELAVFTVRSIGVVAPILPNEPLWLIRLSSRRNPARRKTSALPSDLATETSSRPRAICSTCSSRRMLCRPGSAGRRYFCGPKGCTALARRRAATKPPSSEPFARPCAPPNGFGLPPTVTAKVSSSVRKFSSITSTAVR